MPLPLSVKSACLQLGLLDFHFVSNLITKYSERQVKMYQDHDTVDVIIPIADKYSKANRSSRINSFVMKAEQFVSTRTIRLVPSTATESIWFRSDSAQQSLNSGRSRRRLTGLRTLSVSVRMLLPSMLASTMRRSADELPHSLQYIFLHAHNFSTFKSLHRSDFTAKRQCKVRSSAKIINSVHFELTCICRMSE